MAHCSDALLDSDALTFREPSYSGTRPSGLDLIRDEENAQVAVVLLETGAVLHAVHRDREALLRQAYFGGAPVSSLEPWSYEDEDHQARRIYDLRRQ